MKLKKCPSCKKPIISFNDILKKTLVLNYCSRCSSCNNGWSLNNKFTFLHQLFLPIIGVFFIFIFFDLFDSISYAIFLGMFLLYGFEIFFNYLFPLSKCGSPKKEKRNWLIFTFVPIQIALGFVVGGHVQDLIGFPYNLLGFILGFLILPLLVYFLTLKKV